MTLGFWDASWPGDWKVERLRFDQQILLLYGLGFTPNHDRSSTDKTVPKNVAMFVRESDG